MNIPIEEMSLSNPLTPQLHDIVCVPVFCEARHAIAVQRTVVDTIARLSAAVDPDAGYVPPFKSTDGGADPWSAPEWQPEVDHAAARWLLADLAIEQRRALARFVAVGPKGATAREALAFGKYETDVAAGPVLRAITGRFRKAGRAPIWHSTDESRDGSQIQTVPDDAERELFLNVIREEYPDLAAELRI